MARRKPTRTRAPRWPTPPARLKACIVEDWLDGYEHRPWDGPLGEWPDPRGSYAFGRFLRARIAWRDEHGIPRAVAARLLGPVQAPRWRHAPARGAQDSPQGDDGSRADG